MLECFARYFGEEALRPLAYAETDWGAEIYSRGGYAGVPVPGMLLDHGPALAEPVGRIYWAGAETASEWNGYMDGAVESGERVAQEVLSDLAGDDLPHEKCLRKATRAGGKGCKTKELESIRRRRGTPGRIRAGKWL